MKLLQQSRLQTADLRIRRRRCTESDRTRPSLCVRRRFTWRVFRKDFQDGTALSFEQGKRC